LKPEEKYELRGLVNNVTFPEGAVVVEDKLYVYYGGADSSCCLAICNLNRLLDYLIKLAS
ncbi:MAG: Glycosidase-related protein, partial [Parcubacteria group bacterium GW2011_GWC1_36_9]